MLDTNALPRQGVLRHVVMASVLRVAELRGIRVCLPEVVVDEDVNRRRDTAQAAVDKLREAINQASKVFDVEPVYLPSPDEIAESWRSELEAAFEVLPLDGEDAREALRREAHRQRPAREGRGARDSAIWLTLKRLHEESQEPTHFVSDNVSDFATKDGSTLHGDLADELGDSNVRFHYHRSLADLLGALAVEITHEFPVDAFNDSVVAEQLLTQLQGSGAFDELRTVATLAPDEDVAAESRIECQKVDTIRAYNVDDSGLAMVQLDLAVQLPLDMLRHEAPRAFLPAEVRVRAWVEFNLQDGDIELVTLEGGADVNPMPMTNSASG